MFAALAACGDAGGSGAVASSGVNAAKKVASLAGGELQKLCEWGNELSETGLSDEEVCTYDALLTSSSVECERKRDACLDKIDEGMSPGLLGVRRQDCAKKPLPRVPAGCDATVEALENCHRDLVDAMVADARHASCNKLGTLWTKVPVSCPKGVLACTRLITDGGD